ncbi:MAG TPA: BTAD domain-containing putative transcriptional regulator [Gaiellaceae bacterium]|nr:BTAD domain-containing putative transcriptional regulator [Gaiellaceae bacterium]
MEVRLLGPVELVEGDEVVRITAAKQRALLAVLALQPGRVVPLETIIERLWDEPPPSAAHAVGVYVSELRRQLPSRELLRSRRPGYLVDLPAEAVDALRFERLYRGALESLRRGNLASAVSMLRDALALWGGPAIADARSGPLQREAERLDESRLVAYETCLDAELQLGQVDAVLVDAESLLAKHPLRPQLVRTVMLARLATGRQASALAAYREHQRRLSAELGLAPEESLRALETAILRGELTAPSAAVLSPSAPLPAQLTIFVGRQRELREVERLVTREEVRLLTLTGPGGVGKTRLALQVAAAIADRLEDGVCFVALAAVRDAELAIALIAEKLGVREQTGTTLTVSVADHLAERELLLVLDNFEQVSAAASEVATLLAAAPRLRVLVTSRKVLGLRGEQLYDLPPLSVPSPSDGPEAILNSDAVRLFERRAQAIDPEFTIDHDDAAAVAELCRRLDGLPLAVELAAARIRVLPPKTMLRRLDKRLQFLSGDAPDSEPRQQTLMATIAWSFELLSPSDQELFARLGVFVGGFRLNAAESQVTANNGVTPDVLDGITSLLANSLLRRWDDPDGEPRFWMLETIREFAVARLEPEGLLETCRRLHAAYFADLAARAEPELWRAEQAAWATRLDSDQNNLREALAWALEANEGELALRLAGALEPYWETRGQIAEGQRWLLGALNAAPGATARSRAKAVFGLSRLVQIEGDYAREQALLGEAVQLYSDASDQHGLTFALAHLGLVMGRLGHAAAAEAPSRRAVELSRQLSDEWLLAMALNCQGMALLDAGQSAAAKAAIEESLTIRRALGEKRGIAVTLDSLGTLLVAQGKSSEALAPLEEALSLVRQLDNVTLEAPLLTSLGLAALNAADPERAQSLLTQSLLICREISDREAMSGALVGLAALDLQRDPKRARLLWQLAIALRCQLGSAPLAHVRPTHDLVGRALSTSTRNPSAAEGCVDQRTFDATLSELLNAFGEDLSSAIS